MLANRGQIPARHCTIGRAGQWSKRGVCKVHTSGLRLVNRPLHLYLVKFAHRWLWAHWCSLAGKQFEQQKWECRCYKNEVYFTKQKKGSQLAMNNFLKGTTEGIGYPIFSMNSASRFDRWFLLIEDKFHAWGHLRQVLSASQHLWKLQGSAHEILVRHLAEWVRGSTAQSGNIQDGHLLRDVKELVVLLLLLDILRPREEHLDVLVEVSVLEELAVVLQETDQLLPANCSYFGASKRNTVCSFGSYVHVLDFDLVIVGTSTGSSTWSFPITC